MGKIIYAPKSKKLLSIDHLAPKGFHNSIVVSQNPKPTMPHEAHIIIIIIIGPNDNNSTLGFIFNFLDIINILFFLN
jgi:predicted metal-dependent phosphotriesterase family hydrolase